MYVIIYLYKGGGPRICRRLARHRQVGRDCKVVRVCKDVRVMQRSSCKGYPRAAGDFFKHKVFDAYSLENKILRS